MSRQKKTIVVFLCMLLAFTSIFCVMPRQVQAAETVKLYWGREGVSNIDEIEYVQVEKGAKDFYIGDYVAAENSAGKYYGWLSEHSGVKYSSSKKSVATINSKGKITAKKTGTTTIKIKFKGATAKILLEVVKSLKKWRPQEYSTQKKYAQKCIKAYGTGVTSKNCYAVLSAYKQYVILYNETPLSDIVFLPDGYRYVRDDKNNACGIYFYEPTLGHAKRLWYNVYRSYIAEKDPFNGETLFYIKALSGKGQTITATLKKKVTEKQILSVQCQTDWSTEVLPVNKVSFPIYVVSDDGMKYYAEATIKKGSNKMTIKTKHLKLKKNQTYYLERKDCRDWRYADREEEWLKQSKVTSFKAK